ncbi:threonine synthase [Thermotoga sp. SG1]|uniref:threonine synthase n=1 Tax=Thermotoga sp. SG1 TaxID=126739 RepID=UPI000C7587EA|nr:threonine synthase [Thermotoga sp. SG1]PLV56293.1 threonine synthase [Thermotoga sp. SG1]
MNNVKGLKCRECGALYQVSPIFFCEKCFGPLDVVYHYDRIKVDKKAIEKRSQNIWRYRELLPVDKEPELGLFTGFTPLVKADNLAKTLGVRELYIKYDGVNFPTLSFKDRLVAVAVSKALEFGFNVVACASTGNLANSVAAFASQASLQSYIFIPEDLELGKIVGTSVYKPRLVKVKGSYDDVNRLCTEIALKYNWAFVNINLRPFYSEGSKTFIFEVVEQLGWRAPQNIVVPVGGASLITKIWKGLKELKEVGLIDEIKTRLFAAQPEGCSPVVNALRDGTDRVRPVKPNTIAKSIAIGNPADGIYAVRSVRESNGKGESVSDEEIIEGIKLLAETEGIFTETAGGVVVAVAKKLIEKGVISEDEEVVLAITGNGLKTQEVVSEQLENAKVIDAKLESFEEVLRTW